MSEWWDEFLDWAEPALVRPPLCWLIAAFVWIRDTAKWMRHVD